MYPSLRIKTLANAVFPAYPPDFLLLPGFPFTVAVPVPGFPVQNREINGSRMPVNRDFCVTAGVKIPWRDSARATVAE
jgi:hypothetical protein